MSRLGEIDSTAATATAMSAVSKSLQSLADAQAESVQRLKETNDKLQASLTTTGSMASATRKQLSILQQEQAERAAQLAKKPKLQLYIGPSPLMPGPNFPNPLTYPARDHTDTSITFDSTLRNEGSAPASRLVLRVTLLATDVSFSSNAASARATEPPDNPFHTSFITVDVLRPHAKVPITMTFSFPKGRAPFQVLFTADADEIETGTPLGSLTITPRKTANDELPQTR